MNSLTKIQIRLKHADWPYIIQLFFTYFLILALCFFLFDQDIFYICLLILSLFLLVITQFHIYRVQQTEREHSQYKIQCLNEIYQLLPLRSPLPPMSGWAATPELAVVVLKMIQEYKPNLIVEAGSGVSTLIAGYSLEKYNPEGKIISLDHDLTYAKKTRHESELHNLADRTEIRTATLKEMTINQKECIWYSPEAIQFENPIDMLIIDGPPFKTQKNARYPALPVLYKYLSKRAVIVMHDTDRSSESSTIKRWIREFDDLTIQTLSSEKGITILLRNG
jgi:predicted O-methyltransferase YrrM